MTKRPMVAALASVMLALVSGSLVQSTASAATERPRVIVSGGASQVVEGDVIRVVARVPAAHTAKRVTLERLEMPAYEGIGSPTWEVVKSSAVRDRPRIKFKSIAQQPNVEKLRVRVQYRDRRRARVSKPARIEVWSWVQLREFPAYQYTSGLRFGEASISGRAYEAWTPETWSSARSWESRHTPGRNCRAFRGTAGLIDVSADGSAGAIQLFADEAPVWTSPTLTPGVAVPFEVSLNLPYRFALLATNTSAATLKAFPAIGDPELLCTGL